MSRSSFLTPTRSSLSGRQRICEDGHLARGDWTRCRPGDCKSNPHRPRRGVPLSTRSANRSTNSASQISRTARSRRGAKPSRSQLPTLRTRRRRRSSPRNSGQGVPQAPWPPRTRPAPLGSAVGRGRPDTPDRAGCRTAVSHDGARRGATGARDELGHAQRSGAAGAWATTGARPHTARDNPSDRILANACVPSAA
jgi:hypothetical protein